MAELGPEEKSKMLKRFQTESELQKGGAKFNDEGQLIVTPSQIEGAKEEMRHEKFLDEIELRELDEKIIPDEELEILEKRTFPQEEIENLICSIENLQHSDLRLVARHTDTKGTPILLQWKLKDEVAYQKFGKNTSYFFELKIGSRGKYPERPEGPEPTQITRFSELVDEIEEASKPVEGDSELEKMLDILAKDKPGEVEMVAEYKNGKWEIL